MHLYYNQRAVKENVMTEETTYTMSQAHLLFATDFHGKTWELLDKKQRTTSERNK